ncbi:MAG: fused MFS/spermidine synthase [Anaerolineae bacterium]|nr:fused MFS/spermidine synthase [Anaerolineae bacterium]
MQAPHPTTIDPHRALTRRWQFPALAFAASACTMILELAIQRIVAPYTGMSLYTWTIVIGVVLAGTSAGNLLGGRLADRRASGPLLGGVLALGGVAALCILAIDVLDAFTHLDGISRETLPTIAGLTAFAIAICILPCIVLGAVSPIVVKLALRDLGRAGRTVGQIYAAGALGSIAGTFAAGFALISWLGTHVVVWGVACALLLLGLLILTWRRWPWLLLSVALLAAASAFALGEGWLDGPCTRETDYFCIIVRDETVRGRAVRTLILDRLIHSYSSLDDPTELVYGYEELYAEATAYQAARTSPLRALFIGGGGYTFPRYMEAVYPESELDVVEIDPGVTAIAHDMLGLDQDTRVVTYNEDARTYLERPPTGEYDLVFGDAFNDYSVPYHLTTVEFNDRVRAWLSDDGLYVVNIIDGSWGRFLRAYVHTLRQTFPYVTPAFSVDAWRQSARTTIVILAGNHPLDAQTLRDAAPALADQVLTVAETDAILAEGRAVTLTDRYAPVDQLLLPVFLDQLR